MSRRRRKEIQQVYPLTESDLEKMAKHVLYEMGEALSAFDDWSKLDSQDDRNPTIEVALLHLRVLSNFLLNRGEKDDVIARDYVPGWKPTGSARKLFDDYREPINKRLAHLSRQRIEVQPPWPRAEFESQIKALIESFRQSLTRQQRAWFEKHMSKERLPVSSDSGSTETRSYHYAFLNNVFVRGDDSDT